MASQMESRFVVSHDREGFVSCHRTKREAFDAAEEWWCSANGYDDAEADIYVEDRMSMQGQVSLWGRRLDGGKRYWKGLSKRI